MVKKRVNRNPKHQDDSIDRKYSDDELIDSSVFDHLLPENRRKEKAIRREQNSFKLSHLILVVIILSALIFGGLFNPNVSDNNQNNNNQRNQNDDTDEVDFNSICINLSPGTAEHYPFTLNLYMYGQFFTIPQNVGITSDCINAMHTHSIDNKIHVEYPGSYTGKNPDIRNFFDIWGETLSIANLLGNEGNVSSIVNNNAYDNDISSYIPIDGDVIEISVIN